MAETFIASPARLMIAAVLGIALLLFLIIKCKLHALLAILIPRCSSNWESVLGKNTSITILLPQRRHQPRKQENKKYKVLYALHGLGQDNTNWQRDGILEHLLNRKI